MIPGEILPAAGDIELNAGAPTVTLRTTRFEFLRAATGRRCPAQIAAYDWDGAAPALDLVLPRFTARPDPLEE